MPDQLDPCRVLSWHVCAHVAGFLGKGSLYYSAHSWVRAVYITWLLLDISLLSTLFPRWERILKSTWSNRGSFCRRNVRMRNACCGLGAWCCSAVCRMHWNVRFECWDTMLIFESVRTTVRRIFGHWGWSDDRACKSVERFEGSFLFTQDYRVVSLVHTIVGYACCDRYPSLRDWRRDSGYWVIW